MKDDIGQMIGIDTSRLEVGMCVKNYRELCKILGEDPNTGNAKKAQMKNWERYFEIQKVNGSQKLLIADIYENPKDKVDKRIEGIYVKSIELILLHYLSQQRGYQAYFTKRKLWLMLGMVNEYYKTIPNSELKDIDYCITDFEINNFYQRVDSRLSNILKTALESLEKRFVIEFEKQTVIVDKDGRYHIADDLEIHNILTKKNEIAKSLGCKDGGEQEIFLKRKTAEFYKALNYYYSTWGWRYAFKQYKIIFNSEIARDEISEVENSLQRELLNTNIVRALERGAEKYYNCCREKECETQGDNNKFILPTTYLQAQSLLTDKLIKIRNNREKEITYDLTTEESTELDAIYGIA